MTTAFESATARILKVVFYVSLVFFFTTAAWNTGWHMDGDAFALGPYLPWLELSFPLSGLALWGAFFSQWALGELRIIHISRWFYLLLFAALLMVSVLFSLQPEASLSYLSLWLTASLALSLQLDSAFSHLWFWRIAAALYSFNLGLAWLVPGFVSYDLLLLLGWIMSLLYWKERAGQGLSVFLFGGLLALSYLLEVNDGLPWLLVLSFLVLWIQRFQIFRRKLKGLWYLVMGLILGFALWRLEADVFSVWSGQSLDSVLLDSHNLWFGFGVGQFEWAQYIAQGVNFNPATIISDVPFWQRWWYEFGLLIFPLIMSLWLLTLNTKTNNTFKSTLFWGTLFFFPQLWITTNGVLLGAFWFFNREFWVKTNQTPQTAETVTAKSVTNRLGKRLHWTRGNPHENEVPRSQ